MSEAQAERARPSFIIGTAGHVDHGKTTLIRALTGQDTDRLPQEKKRGISIELGFAALTLPSGLRVGVVDVPGHERYVRHMVAGAWGMDLILLVVAADEGVMPQTVEHLAILDLLGAHSGAVVVTKTAGVEPEWLKLVEEDLAEATRGTFLEGAPVFRVDSPSRQGVDDLIAHLDRMLQALGPRPSDGRLRLPIDRVFTVQGFGTVVTGTLMGSALNVDDRLVVYPSERPVRVRSLQVHGQSTASAHPGQRVAANLVGVEKDDLARGETLARPQTFHPDHLVTCHVRLLPSAAPIKNGDRVHLHIFTAHTVGRVTLLSGNRLQAGKSGYVRIRSDDPLVVSRGDRLVLRSFSPVTTVAGGEVLAVGRRFRRGHAGDREELDLLVARDWQRLVRRYLEDHLLVRADELERTLSVGEDVLFDLFARLQGEGDIAEVSGRRLSRPAINTRLKRVHEELEALFARERLAPGLAREELRQRLFGELDAKVFADLLEWLQSEGLLGATPDHVTLPGRSVVLTPEEERTAAALEGELMKAPFAPPAPAELRKLAEPNVDVDALLRFLVGAGRVVRLGELYFAAQAVEQAEALLKEHFQTEPEITMAQWRDLLGTSRKYALLLAEYFDDAKVTRRRGDVRVRA